MRPIPGSAGGHSHGPGHSVGYQQQWTMASSQPLALLDASPVAAKYNSSYTWCKIVIQPLILFVLIWNCLFRWQIFCKNNHTFLNFSTGNVCELTSRSHHSEWATWAGPGAGHPTERAGVWDSGSISPPHPRTVGKPLFCSHQPRGDSSVMCIFRATNPITP